MLALAAIETKTFVAATVMCLAAGYERNQPKMVQDMCARGSDRQLSATGVDVDVEWGCVGVLSNHTGRGKCS